MRALVEIPKNGFGGFTCAQVDISGFKPHGMQEARFIALSGHGREFHARTVRRQPPHNPASLHTDERVDGSYGTIQDFLVMETPGSTAFGPEIAGRSQSLGLARNLTAGKFRDGNIAFSAQATEPCNAVCHTVTETPARPSLLNGLLRACWEIVLGRESVEFCPEPLGIAQYSGHH